MEILTFDDDLLGLEDFATRLESFINIEHRYVEGGLVVGLNSKFGSGKSTFLRMWTDSLQNKKEESNYIVILLNAWESDYYGDPLFAIVSALIDSIQAEGKKADKIIEAAKDLGWFSTAIANQIVSKFSGIDSIEAGEVAKKKKKERSDKYSMLSDTFSIYEGRKHAMQSLKGAIQDFIKSENSEVLFLVDELDRCRPDYAISYLETIKHIFDINRATFVLAADKQHLENSAKTAFGPNLDFDEYYRKFVHREVSLPEISDKGYQSISSKYVNFYMHGEGTRNCYMAIQDSRDSDILELIISCKLTPRQIQNVFRVLGHVLETTEEKKGDINWCWAVGTILMAVLKTANHSVYNKLATQQMYPQDALDFFKDKLNVQYEDWWFSLCLTGGGIAVKNDETHESIFKEFGFMDKDSTVRDLLQFTTGWGIYREKNRFNKIYEKIEQLEQWK